MKYKIGILGCGAIFDRHVDAIKANNNFYEIVGIYDPDTVKLERHTSKLNVKAYALEGDLYNDPCVNCVVILTPNYLHYTQALDSINAGKHVIIEKPATFAKEELTNLINAASSKKVNIFTILQVRLNRSVIIAKNIVTMLGKIRNVSLVQKWQRPVDYLNGWRGDIKMCGGMLREFSIHYLDVLQYLVGCPKVLAASSYVTKFMHSATHDTVNALLDFGNYGGVVDISIAAEPRNLECSLCIIGDNGFLRLGGKSLDEISYDFIDQEKLFDAKRFASDIMGRETANLVAVGVSPYHPEVYRQIIANPDSFLVSQSINVISLIEDIYSKCGI